MIAGAGFTRMAWALARERKGNYLHNSVQPGPLPRAWLSGKGYPISREYYRICDRAAQGVACARAAHNMGMHHSRFTVRL